MSLFKTRTIKYEDTNFITSSWLRSFRTSIMFKTISNDIYYDQHQKLVKDLLMKSEVILAVNNEDEDQIFGYICIQGGYIVHYVYVKEPYRNMGIAKELIKEALRDRVGYYTHWDKSMKVLLPGAIYNPFLAVYEGKL